MLRREIPHLSNVDADDIGRVIRGEWGGERVYIPARTASNIRLRRARQVLKLFNGRNATEVARQLQCSRATVYRALKQAGADGES